MAPSNHYARTVTTLLLLLEHRCALIDALVISDAKDQAVNNDPAYARQVAWNNAQQKIASLQGKLRNNASRLQLLELRQQVVNQLRQEVSAQHDEVTAQLTQDSNEAQQAELQMLLEDINNQQNSLQGQQKMYAHEQAVANARYGEMRHQLSQLVADAKVYAGSNEDHQWLLTVDEEFAPTFTFDESQVSAEDFERERKLALTNMRKNIDNAARVKEINQQRQQEQAKTINPEQLSSLEQAYLQATANGIDVPGIENVAEPVHDAAYRAAANEAVLKAFSAYNKICTTFKKRNELLLKQEVLISLLSEMDDEQLQQTQKINATDDQKQLQLLEDYQAELDIRQKSLQGQGKVFLNSMQMLMANLQEQQRACAEAFAVAGQYELNEEQIEKIEDMIASIDQMAAPNHTDATEEEWEEARTQILTNVNKVVSNNLTLQRRMAQEREQAQQAAATKPTRFKMRTSFDWSNGQSPRGESVYRGGNDYQQGLKAMGLRKPQRGAAREHTPYQGRASYQDRYNTHERYSTSERYAPRAHATYLTPEEERALQITHGNRDPSYRSYSSKQRANTSAHENDAPASATAPTATSSSVPRARTVPAPAVPATSTAQPRPANDNNAAAAATAAATAATATTATATATTSTPTPATAGPQITVTSRASRAAAKQTTAAGENNAPSPRTKNTLSLRPTSKAASTASATANAHASADTTAPAAAPKSPATLDSSASAATANDSATVADSVSNDEPQMSVNPHESLVITKTEDMLKAWDQLLSADTKELTQAKQQLLLTLAQLFTCLILAQEQPLSAESSYETAPTSTAKIDQAIEQQQAAYKHLQELLPAPMDEPLLRISPLSLEDFSGFAPEVKLAIACGVIHLQSLVIAANSDSTALLSPDEAAGQYNRYELWLNALMVFLQMSHSFIAEQQRLVGTLPLSKKLQKRELAKFVPVGQALLQTAVARLNEQYSAMPPLERIAFNHLQGYAQSPTTEVLLPALKVLRQLAQWQFTQAHYAALEHSQNKEALLEAQLDAQLQKSQTSPEELSTYADLMQRADEQSQAGRVPSALQGRNGAGIAAKAQKKSRNSAKLAAGQMQDDFAPASYHSGHMARATSATSEGESGQDDFSAVNFLLQGEEDSSFGYSLRDDADAARVRRAVARAFDTFNNDDEFNPRAGSNTGLISPAREQQTERAQQRDTGAKSGKRTSLTSKAAKK